MADRIYYVICSDNCKFEGMTKEQIIAAIAEATGKTPTDVDAAFITKIKEQNANTAVKIWVGTSAEFNALTEKDADTLYYYDDEDYTELSSTVEKIINGTTPVAEAVHAVNADNAINTDFTNSEWSSLVDRVGISVFKKGELYQLKGLNDPDVSVLLTNDFLYASQGVAIHIENQIEVVEVSGKYEIKSIFKKDFIVGDDGYLVLKSERYYLGDYTDAQGRKYITNNLSFQYRRIR